MVRRTGGNTLRGATVLRMLVAVLVALAVPSAALGRTHPRRAARPDLVIAGGSVRLTGGVVRGSFVVENVGSRWSAPSSAALSIGVGNRLRTLGSFRVPGLARSGTHVVRVAIRLPVSLGSGSYPVSVCANSSASVIERTRGNDCRVLGKLMISRGTTGGTGLNPSPAPTLHDHLLSLRLAGAI
jgi:hypothetical protein